MDQKQGKQYFNKIKVYGIVQGVGFRPFVYSLAKKYAITGSVKNLGGIVEIITKATKEQLHLFLEELKNPIGQEYEIVHLEISEIHNDTLEYDENVDFTTFKILESGNNKEISRLPVDLPTCEKCRDELVDCKDRRYHNPFISCALCGPRYTIMEKLPYDRGTTVMKDFPMCNQCKDEYTNVSDRRFHAQTISCNDCGPKLIFGDWKEEEALRKAVKVIRDGGIIAVKGIGGYHLVCSPFMEETVLNLRKLKGREDKAFAVMFENIDSIKEYTKVTPEEEYLLTSKARPIVLLFDYERKFPWEVNRDSLYLGAFLPYTPLQILLLRELGPLIMTSANLSGSPIIKEDDKMLAFVSPYLDGVLYHKRRIIRRVDDSVVKVVNGKVQYIRRSRGYVPNPVSLYSENKNVQIVGTGGDLKSTFCLYKDGNAVVSQYFGDLEDFKVLEEYKNSYGDLKELLHIEPNYVVCDMHPNYHSVRYATTLGLPIKYVQHHHAHIASVMAEHQITDKLIGVAFDGTGYGLDGNVWGGEFLVCEKGRFQRKGHLAYNYYIGGDSSQKDAKKTATCLLLNASFDSLVEDERVQIISAALNGKINTHLSSSMGRLFDGVASILNICHYNDYEGKCAILLENEALLAMKENSKAVEMHFQIEENEDGITIGYKEVLSKLLQEKNTRTKGELALGFHKAVINMTVTVCDILRNKENINQVALSGGVFQNSILLEGITKALEEKEFLVYTNKELPPNDGSISLGQVYLGLLDEKLL